MAMTHTPGDMVSLCDPVTSGSALRVVIPNSDLSGQPFEETSVILPECGVFIKYLERTDMMQMQTCVVWSEQLQRHIVVNAKFVRKR